MTSSVYGAQWARQQGITKAILQLAQRCPVYSIRAAAFYSISLSATNSEGADTLRAAGKLKQKFICANLILIKCNTLPVFPVIWFCLFIKWLIANTTKENLKSSFWRSVNKRNNIFSK